MLKWLQSRLSNAAPARDEQPSETTRAVQELQDQGACLLPGVLTPAQCEAITAGFEAYVQDNRTEADAHLLNSQRHSRLCNLHLVCGAAQEAIAQPRVMHVLDAFFQARAFVATSLYFEQSSEQAIHRDTPFFNTQPRDLYAGIWFALEDVHPDSGPLRYFPGGHRLQVPVQTVDSSEAIGPAWSAYCDRMLLDLQAQGYEERTALLRQGDCFIWHPELPHGGSPIRAPGMTRRSMVFHCASEEAVMYGIEEFFGLRPYDSRQHGFAAMGTTSRRMLDHGRPQFAANG